METIDLLKWTLNAFELAACIAGFLNWQKLKNTYWKYFPVYLGIIFLAEMTGKYLNVHEMFAWKVGLYNYFVIPLEILFFIWLFYKELSNTIYRWLPLVAAGIYVSCWAIDMFFISKQPLWWVQSFSYAVGIVCLLSLILSYLVHLTNSEDILLIRQKPMFWVCLGLFVFYFCTLPFYGMGNYLFHKHPSIYIGYAYATYFLNFIMYLFFILSTIWGIPKLSYSLRSSH